MVGEPGGKPKAAGKPAGKPGKGLAPVQAADPAPVAGLGASHGAVPGSAWADLPAQVKKAYTAAVADQRRRVQCESSQINDGLSKNSKIEPKVWCPVSALLLCCWAGRPALPGRVAAPAVERDVRLERRRLPRVGHLRV